MNDIDFIKWMCDKSEGFKMIGNAVIKIPSGNSNVIRKFVNHKVNYPLLLQRAIEGYNKIEYEKSPMHCCWLSVESDCIAYNGFDLESDEEKNFFYEEYRSIDQAKESALRYIYEQEDK